MTTRLIEDVGTREEEINHLLNTSFLYTCLEQDDSEEHSHSYVHKLPGQYHCTAG